MRDCVGYEGRYAVTSCGKVWSYRSNRFLTIDYFNGNYQMVTLVDADGKCHNEYVHRLVAKAYISNPDPQKYTDVNHKDEVKDHNWVNNLEWCDRKYNNNYGNRTQRAAKAKRQAVYCVELDKRFDSIKQAAEATGIHQGNLSSLLKHNKEENHTLGGYHWRYAK